MVDNWLPCQCCSAEIRVDRVRERRTNANDGVSYVDMMYDCFAIRIPTDVNKPIMCKRCVGRLKESYAFKRRIQQTQAALNDALAIGLMREFDDKGVKLSASSDDCSDDGFAYSDSLPLKTYFAEYAEHVKIEPKGEPVDCYDPFAPKPPPFKKSPRKKSPEKESSFYCEICHKTLTSKAGYRKHMAVHDGGFKCDKCSKAFRSQKLLDIHAPTHETYKKCTICERVITRLAFQRHMDSHANKLIFCCPVESCEERFKDIHQRYRHMGDVHKMDIYKFKCTLCPKSFYLRSVLRTHIKDTHNRELKRTCDVCAYQCHTIRQLKEHMLKHYGEKTHQCSVCPKAFVRSKTLKEHMKIHNSFKALKCPFCDQGFTQRVSLKGHMSRIHAKTL